MHLPNLAISPFQLWTQIFPLLQDLPAYSIILRHYDEKCARRSGLPYLNHIHEGAFLLSRLIGWCPRSVSAYCLHPILQDDQTLDLVTKGNFNLSEIDVHAIVLAMEYRRIANNYLSTHPICDSNKIELSPILNVNRMLIADKIQNKKDFLATLGKYPNKVTESRESHLIRYFDSWLKRLDVSSATYDRLVKETNEALQSG